MTGLQTEYDMRLAAEKALAGKIQAQFTAAEKATLKKFLALYGDPDILSFQVREILDPWYKLEPRYNDTILYENTKALRNGRKSTVNLINIQKNKNEQLRLFDFDRSIYNNLRNQTFTASAHTMERVRQDIMKNVAQSYSEGLGIKDAARNLNKKFTALNGYEANRIARTEINSAQNVGNYQTLIDYDINYQQWWTGQDARVRDSHRALHAMITKIGNKFPNGLLHPGDRSGSIKEWIHCRCTIVPYLMPLGFMAPPGMNVFRESDIIPIPGMTIDQKIILDSHGRVDVSKLDYEQFKNLES